jgi:microcystin-dependent protein
MAISFPTNLDTLTNPNSTDALNSPSHSDQHSDANDAIEALEAKVGIDGSAVATSHDYKLAHLTASDITDLTASADELNKLNGVTSSTDELNILDGVTADKDEINLLDGKTTLDSTPTGAITMYGGATAPTDWLLCDGSAVSRTTYAALFTAISTTYGVGDNSTTFNVPNLKGKFPIGLNSSDGDFDTLGETGGAKTKTIAQANLPNISTGAGSAHTHTQNAHGHTQDAHTHTQNAHGHRVQYQAFITGGGANHGPDSDNGTYKDAGTWIENTTATNQNTTATNQNTTATNQNESTHTHSLGGSGTALNVVNPYIVVNYIIKT